jgi:hypothetical protein
MIDSSVSSEWLLLIHQLPPKPDYVRVKVRRRLDRIGALPLRGSVYILPMGEATLEDFQWLAREIQAEGGEATVCSASFLQGTSDDELVEAFVDARSTEYSGIAAAAEGVATVGDLARLTKRFGAVAAVDYFDVPARAAADRALRAAEERVRGPQPGSPPDAEARLDEFRGRMWVTRAGVFVDRVASAWLIRRFIDPEARFRFVTGARYRPEAGELRFDMFEAEYTHEGDRCTFEVLLERFALRDPALEALAEIVHDIDLKDEKFGRAETAGVAAVLQGIAATTSDDSERLARGGALFDGLYATMGGR